MPPAFKAASRLFDSSPANPCFQAWLAQVDVFRVCRGRSSSGIESCVPVVFAACAIPIHVAVQLAHHVSNRLIACVLDLGLLRFNSSNVVINT
jgi:hypothetical protein